MKSLSLITACSVLALSRMATADTPPATAYTQTGAPLAPTATNAPPAPPAPGPALAAAVEAAQAAVKACLAIEQNVGVTIVDSAGIPKVVLASDGASARGVQSSTNKALTALTFKAATSELAERAKNDAHLQEQLNANPVYNSRAGGLVLLQGTTVLGAVGVGGAKGSEKDEQCAHAALARLQKGK
jgi:uncharacterized protein GlcG (DUF336 family)